ncbi:MAG: sporulation initiation inhibitor protein Soj [Acidobacteriota bacterium]|nr:MAG: ParA family protein [Acidobacteriota bacterium]
MKRTIAVANQKGGVGKTTTTVNLGAGLALAGRRTLIVDLDPQANSTRALGFERDVDRPSIYDVLIEGTPLADVVLPTEMENLFLCPSENELTGAEVELAALPRREYRLAERLPQLEGWDFVLLDCPPSLGFLTVNALTAADSVLIPIQCEYLALEGVTQLIETLRRVKRSLNPRLAIEGVLLTMFDERTNLSRQVAEEVYEFFQDAVYETVIPRNIRLGEAPSFGKPIFMYDARSKGATAYLELAREILGREGRAETQSAG